VEILKKKKKKKYSIIQCNLYVEILYYFIERNIHNILKYNPDIAIY